MSGEFLPFKYYGATGNAQAYGHKEEIGRGAAASPSPLPRTSAFTRVFDALCGERERASLVTLV